VRSRRALVIAATLAACSRSGLAIDVPPPPPCEDGGCPLCEDGARECRGDDVWACVGGERWEEVEHCPLEDGFVCARGECVLLCDENRLAPSHIGCVFWSVDLDNSASVPRDVSRLPYGVTVANPWPVPIRVVVERDDAPAGGESLPVGVLSRVVPPLDHEEIELPRREVDGPADGAPTHTALTAHAYRITTSHPVAIVQANPLEAAGFSRDTSLLLPSEMLGSRTTVLGWPQTIADGDTPETDFDPSVEDEDLRAFLAIVGTVDGTRVSIRLGRLGGALAAVVPGGPVPELRGGDTLEVVLGAFDVLNLETRGLGADPTGTVIESDRPLAVFAGSEASDVPRFASYADRQCCADHLEEQLWPDVHAGTHYVVGRRHSRRLALARAMRTSTIDVPEPEWVHVVAIDEVQLSASPPLTGLPSRLRPGEDAIARLDASHEIGATGGRIHVASALAGQDVIGVLSPLPGGDPSFVLVPPTESFARRADVVVPGGSPFDFVTIVAPREAIVLWDGSPLAELAGPDGLPACRSEESTGTFVVHQCSIAFPIVGLPPMDVLDGAQADGLHTVLADHPIGVSVSGFERYIAYGHPGAMRAR
jgi:hypothetical protein